MKKEWVEAETRVQVVDFVKRWTGKTELAIVSFIAWLGLSKSTYYNWQERDGKVNEHNQDIPRDHWLQKWEKEKIVDFYLKNPLEGYRVG